MPIPRPARAIAITALTLSAACTHDALAPSPVPDLGDPAYTAGPPGGFRLVMVRAGASASTEAGAPVVDNLADAVARVAAGGTIRISEGVYLAEDVLIDRPMVIEPAAGAAPTVRTGAVGGFLIRTTLPGTVTIRGLHVEVLGVRGILAAREYDQVVLENLMFTTTAGPFSASGGLPAGWIAAGAALNMSPTSRFTVRGSTITGGHWGLIATAARADFVDNTLSRQALGGLQLESGSEGRISGNTFDGCGAWRCIGVASASEGVVVSANTISIAHPARVRSAIQAFGGGTVTIERNRITGTGGAGREVLAHPMEFGIEVRGGPGRTAVTTVRGNHVSGAYNGLTVGGASRGVIEGNIVDPCGAWGCIAVFSNGVTGADVAVRGNTVRSILDRRTFFAIHSGWEATAGRLSITDNTIMGATPPSNTADPSTYALDIAFQNGTWYPGGLEGIPLGDAVEFSRNRISDAAVGVRAFHGGVIEGRDNTFTTIFGEVLGAHDRGVLRLRFNDVLGHRFALGMSGSPVADEPHRGTLEVTCNYWGGGAPNGVWDGMPASAYTPFARSPIAGTGATTCTP